jgi:Protein of unknown function (DUF1878)
MADDTLTLESLDARLREVEAVQQLMMRIIATTKPLDNLLERYGATTTQEQAFYKLLDELVTRSKGREQEQPTFGYFTMQLAQVFPALKNDRDFIATVIDTLKIERPVYQDLHSYMIAHGWPAWG